MALAQQTPYILLDEPTTYLDLRYPVESGAAAHPDPPARAHRGGGALHDLNFAVNYGDSLVLRQGKLEGVLHGGS